MSILMIDDQEKDIFFQIVCVFWSVQCGLPFITFMVTSNNQKGTKEIPRCPLI